MKIAQYPAGPAGAPDPNEENAVVSFDFHTNIGPNDQREVEPTFFFMLNCLLYSRIETGHPSNEAFYDEDVNMYLTNLLCSFMNPDYHRRTRKYVSRYDTSLFQKVQASNDARLKYTIYKTNADFLLVSIGIFNDPGNVADPLPQLKNQEEAHVGRGKAYYQFAYSYSQSMFKKSTGISEVLEKLSKGFERYVEILSHMRGEYFNILDRLSSGEVYHLERSIDKVSADQELQALQDRFLDMCSRYLKSRDPELKQEIEELVVRIRQIDATFDFHMDD